jgi:hypothetical protein
MSEDAKKKTGIDLPPKLDLKRSGILKTAEQMRAEEDAVAERQKAASPVPTEVETSVPAPAPALDQSPSVPVPVEEKQSVREPVSAKEVQALAGNLAGANAEQAGPATDEPAKPEGLNPEASSVEPAKSEGHKQTSAGDGDVGGKTARIAIKAAASGPSPAPSPAPAGRIQIGKLSQKKKETSRIPLEAAQPGAKTSDGAKPSVPRTIRLKPAGKPPTIGMPTATAGEKAATAKRETSRISLEAALSGQSSGEFGEKKVPKTIKLKRPSEAPTVKAVKPAAATPKPEPAQKLSDTSRLDVEASDEASDEAIPPTRRKTIRVKRPTGGRTVPTPVVRRAGGPEAVSGEGGGGVDAEQAVISQGGPPEPHWFFAACAMASILVVIVTIYVFAAQTFGRDFALTRMSYWKDGPDLPWPNKLQHQRRY